MKKVLWPLVLLLLLALAVFTRLYKLSEAPATLIIDEAHYAYISYSLLKTGKDEHGLSYPMVFKGFGDYKLPAQVYALLPFVSFFDLNNLAARLPAAISGILLVFVVYLLFLEWKFSKKAAFLAALLTLISPWTFILSRFAYEANLGLLFFSLALLFIFKARLKPNLLFFLLSALFFALSIYAYVIYKFIAVFFVLFFAVYFFFFSKKNKLKTGMFLTFFSLLIVPFFFGQAANSNLARFKQVGVFSNEQLIATVNENRHFCLQNYPKLLCYGIFNKPIVYSKELINDFIKSYSPEYLFIKGDENLTYMNVDDTGLFATFLLPLYLIGLATFVYKFFNKKNKESKLFLFFLLSGLLIVPIPAILSGVQKIRISALFIFILPIFIMAYEFLNEKLTKKVYFDFLLLVLCLISLSTYFVNFISVHASKKDFYYDSFAKDIFSFTDDYIKKNEVDEVIIQSFFSDPLMYYAYYQKIEPSYYQSEIVLDQSEGSGFQHALSLGKYRVAKNEEPNTLACAAHLKGLRIIYVDNHWLSKDHILTRIKSKSGALTYAFIIDLSSFGEELTRTGKCK